MSKSVDPHPLSSSSTCICEFYVGLSHLTDLMAAAGPAILEDDELVRELAKIIYYKEVEAIKSKIFESEPDQAKYLRDCKANYESVLSLLDAGAKLKQKNDNDETKSPIAHDIFSYIIYCANSALQTVNNYTLRMNYLRKIGEHARSIMEALNNLDPNNLINVRLLAKEAVLYRNAMLQFTRMHQSTASRSFSRWLKESGLRFPDLVRRYQTKLGFEGPFENLVVEQKLQVYGEIIEASGRGRAVVNQFSKALGVAGIAVLLVTAGIMVWDIFSSDHIFQTATHDAIVTVASVGGAMLGEVVGTALATLAGGGVEASAMFVLMAGIVGGLAGAIIVGTFVAWFIDLIIGSGGSAVFSTDGHKCYVEPLPDGELLALQIAHHHKFPN